MPRQSLSVCLGLLGDISADRFVQSLAPGTATKADLIQHGKPTCELIEGTLVRRPIVPFEDAVLCAALGTFLNLFVQDGNLGIITGSLAPVELRPGVIRVFDLAYTNWSRMPERRIPRVEITPVVPALAVDFLRDGHSSGELIRKCQDCFAVGVEEYWLVDSRNRTIAIFDPSSEVRVLDAADALATPVLPGFTLSLAELFGELDRHG